MAPRTDGAGAEPRVVFGAPLYNQAAHLPAALDSLLAQTRGDFALVLVDDLSDDETERIARDYARRDPRVTYVRNPTRLGLSGNWRRCFELARERHPGAEYFAWASDHDIWPADWLESMIEGLETTPEAVLVYPTTERIDAEGEVLNQRGGFDTVGVSDPTTRLRLGNGSSIRAGNLVYGLIRVSALERSGVFRAVLEPDRLLLAELSVHGSFRHLPEARWRRRFVKLATRARQRRAIFPHRRPLYSWLPPWVQRPVAFSWVYAARRGPLGDVSRVDGLRLSWHYACGSFGALGRDWRTKGEKRWRRQRRRIRMRTRDRRRAARQRWRQVRKGARRGLSRRRKSARRAGRRAAGLVGAVRARAAERHGNGDGQPPLVRDPADPPVPGIACDVARSPPARGEGGESMSPLASSTTQVIANVIDGCEREAASGESFEKLAPATGEPRSRVARSDRRDVDAAITAAHAAAPGWATRTVAERGAILRRIAQLLERDATDLAAIVAGETGKSPGDATGEVGAAIEMGYFVAGEGRRFYGRTTTSAVPNRQAMTVRQPLGVAGLIIAANTPIANVAWKVFPALLCGNAAVLKASEDTPETALAFARLAAEAHLPPGVLNVVHGYGEEAGQPLVEDPRVDVVSFTGSTAVGRMINRVAGDRLAKVCLELGGKNPLIVCDDADLDRAAEAAALSAFSNAGQRCAAGSRILVFESVYDGFVARLCERADAQRVGPENEHDYGAVINERQLENMVAAVRRARDAGATVVCGGERLTGPEHDGGFYMAPTLVEGADLDAEIACTELFGPIATIHRVAGFEEALEAAERGPYGLTAAIWTANVHRAQEFVARVRSGVASVNGPTYGSEPHMPFGGEGDSGTGWREAGTEALDVYSDWKTVYVNHDPGAV